MRYKLNGQLSAEPLLPKTTEARPKEKVEPGRQVHAACQSYQEDFGAEAEARVVVEAVVLERARLGQPFSLPPKTDQALPNGRGLEKSTKKRPPPNTAQVQVQTQK